MQLFGKDTKSILSDHNNKSINGKIILIVCWFMLCTVILYRTADINMHPELRLLIKLFQVANAKHALGSVSKNTLTSN